MWDRHQSDQNASTLGHVCLHRPSRTPSRTHRGPAPRPTAPPLGQECRGPCGPAVCAGPGRRLSAPRRVGVPIPLALSTAAVLLTAGLVGSYVVAPWLALTIGAYAFIQAGYNLGLKEQPIIDIMVIAGGFVLRALGGAAAAGVPASGWFILCIGLLAFFLGIEKRKAELREVGEDEETRSVLQEYSLSWLRRMESVVTASALMAYALWTLEGADTPWMLATLPFVAYAIFRYQYLSEKGHAETPVKTLIQDVGLLMSITFWASISLLILIAL